MGAKMSSLSSTVNYYYKSFKFCHETTKEFDVFVSFTGKTRKGFTSHLIKELNRVGLRTFTDELLPRGESISDVLTDRIKGSRSTIIVFSKDYAASRSCLDELLQSFKCKEEDDQGHLIFPIFYKVDPSELRRLNGQTGHYLSLHGDRFGDNSGGQVALWKTCLMLLSDIAGWHYTNSESESALIERVVREVATTLRMKRAAFL